ncbi:hypothetical protein Goarm_005784 [Gossypium armourianum]|uniref:RNase H type-1 domain-containing protein n=1 Tax=Gossypium armourianum TaxID=34283 RepID=A0A7J9KIE5_9ROSI|nr:hypothetical protein [Gossypium armourianum]
MNVKVNFDATFDKQHRKSYAGIIIRNSTGQDLKVKVYNNGYIPAMFASEALACVQAIRFGVESSFLRVEVEGGTLTIIKKIQSEKEEIYKIRAYISNAKRLRSNFITCKFKHARRQTKKVAHIIAKEGLNKYANTYLANSLSSLVAWAVEDDIQGGGRGS